MALSKIESRLERLVEGVFNRTMKSGLQPVELGRRLTREMDLARQVGVRTLLAPNVFEIEMSPIDRERISTIETALARDLSLVARDHASNEGYSFAGHVLVEFITNPKRKAGSFRVNCEFDAEVLPDGPLGALALSDGRRIELTDQPFTIGRTSDCDLVVNDTNVSRRHVELRHEPEGFKLRDLKSTNGTKVNGARVSERLLADGDEISVGNTSIWFEAG
jgi:hypothetical protein